ncbi:tripartite tricarboxylate transporter substrate binding protein [Xylophilus sp. GOD-11R]|uniref:Bug family tripartite tricarboxylate transporter substrate binding protein n=1 Tax=Xylophilus sp. GOD-11R TaxID=3089814 RepID=UPI00298C4A0C|nr:tripartite tricarboxylate transporter substrate binding protein [Xylophilus sp. GOD-11R]WPB56512.1 tripartite tricarboxylate transporter substrate binding protein [Xylophilus sp. GOD-11R]
MPINRRCAALALAITALAGPLGTAFAAGYPEQPIKLVVGFPPGGGGDLYGRLIAQALGKTLGQSVVVDNRAGAGGNIAADLVAKARPDGYTILLAMSGNLAVAPATRPQALPYQVPDDFAPIGLILEAPHGLFVAHNSRFRSAREVLDAAKTQRLTFASTGTGAAAHMGMEMVKQAAGIDMLHVPYKGSGPAITDMLGGQVDTFFATASPLVGQVRQGQLRLLAITGDKRSPAIPDVPTFKELGVNVPVTQWYGLVAPAGTPEPVLRTLQEHLSRALATAEVRDAIRKDAAVEHDLTGEAFRRFIVDDIARYRRAITPALLKEISP